MSEQADKAQRFTFHGEVLEVLDRDGHRVARVFTPGFFIEVAVDEAPYVHLGDFVQVAGSMEAKLVSQLSDLPVARRAEN